MDNAEMMSMTATKNFSLTIRHIGLLKDMENRSGKDPSKLTRIAIERLYAQFDEAMAETQTPAPTVAEKAEA